MTKFYKFDCQIWQRFAEEVETWSFLPCTLRLECRGAFVTALASRLEGLRAGGSGGAEGPPPDLRCGAHGGDVRERRLAKFRQNVARFWLYRLRFLQENMRFAAFFKIYQILKLKFLKFQKFDKNLQILRHLQFFLLKFHENCCFFKPIFC